MAMGHKLLAAIRSSRIWIGVVVGLLLMYLAGEVVWGQYGQRRRNRGYRNRYEESSDPRNGVPDWQVDRRHRRDVFTFVRGRYTSGGWGDKWRTDYPDSDLNFSYRLQELTSLRTDPDGLILDLDDPRLLEYPFLYVIEPGAMALTESEVAGLRKYLLQGGFMMVDDFWGEDEYGQFYSNLKRVLPEPEHEPVELELDHKIFHMVYDLKEKPQVPSIHAWWGGSRTERWDADVPHYKGVFDSKGRMMAIICHNTDLGDGWEREGLDPEYFREFSEKWSYPLGINIVVYAMTH